jgi:hypothetical protein
MIPALFSLIVLFAMVISSAGWGYLFLRLGRFDFGCSSERLAFSSLLGFGLIGYLVLAMGLTGFLYSSILWMILISGCFLSVPAFYFQTSSTNTPCVLKENQVYRIVTWIILGGSVLAALIRLNVPPTTADELTYHLFLPKLYLLRHAIFYLPAHVNSVFPLSTELLYSFGIALRSDIAIKGVHFLFGGVTAWLLFLFSKRYFKDIPPFWAPLVFLTTPIINHQMGLANNDLALTAFLFGAYFGIFRWMERGEIKWLVLAGALSGFAMGVKYLALFAIAIQFFILIVYSVMNRLPLAKMIRVFFVFALSIFLVGAVWHIRSFLYTHNPIYPYLTKFFSGTGLESPLRLEGKGFGKGPLAFLLLGWHMTYYPDKFGGVSNQWGPLFLGFLPWLALVRRQEKEWRYVLLFTGMTFLLWFLSKQNLRFLLPALPFCCLLVAAVLKDLMSRSLWVQKVSKILFLLFLGLDLAIAGFHLRRDYRVALGLEKKEEYLAREMPIFRVAAYLNKMPNAQAFKILSQDQRGYYFEGEAVREVAYRKLSHYDKVFEGNPQEFYKKLREEGFSHLLIHQIDGVQPVGVLNQLTAHEGIEGEKPKKVFETRFHEAGKKGLRTYLLFEL